MSERLARLVLVALLPAVIAVSGFVPFLAARSELPAEVASHFDLSGTPDDAMSLGGFLAVTSSLIALGVACSIAVGAVRRPLPPLMAPLGAFLGGFIGLLGAAILAWTALSQRGINHWRDAPSPSWSFLAVILGPIAAGLAAAWIGSALPTIPSDPTEAGDSPVLPLGPGEHAVWTATIQVRWQGYAGVAMIVAGVVIATGTLWWIMLPSLVSGLAVLWLSVVRLRADQAGLHLSYGLASWPRTRIPIERIDRASTIDVRPLQWGGWGYRGSLTLMRQAAVVLRAGPGLRLDLVDGKVFVVTVDHPEDGAALLNAERARHGAPPG